MRRDSSKLENGHHFNFSTDVCDMCGMGREHYDDNGKPHCKGRDAKPKKRDPLPIEC
jgi:hypothetical protein